MTAGRISAASILALLAALLLAAPALAGPTAGGAAERPAAGALKLRVLGLPPGERAVLTVSGPAQRPGGRPFRQRLAPTRRTALKLRPGSYRVRVAKVRLRRSHRRVKAGATALPLRRKLRVKVRAGAGAALTVRYGTILNPGVRDVSGRVVRVMGGAASPSAVVLRPGTPVARGSILSARPTAALPQGLLARVVSVQDSSGKPVAILRAASIYEVAPNMTFDIPLATTDGASASQVIKCSDSTDVKPYVNVGQFRATGGWTTSGWGPFKATTGAKAEVHFRAAAGLGVSARAGLSCSLKLPSVGFQGMAGPIPVYGAVRPGASVEVGASGTIRTEVSTDVTVGAKINGLPPGAAPIVDFGSPKVDFDAAVFVGVKAGLSLSAELGIGAMNAANLHADLTNSLSFVASPGRCSWDLDLGSFSAGGELGPFSISTPSTPPLYHRNLWQASCGPPPPPPPPPPAPTGPALPLARAAMDWDTDSDIDLYTWDEFGNLISYYEREGIPGAALVEDVIPDAGENLHAREIFLETANPNRRYTFGVCNYRGEGAEVTVTVVDPGGGTRTYGATLYEPGDSQLITTSPLLGGGFIPEPGWCDYFGD